MRCNLFYSFCQDTKEKTCFDSNISHYATSFRHLRKFYDFWGEKSPFLLKKIWQRGTLLLEKSFTLHEMKVAIKTKRRAKNEISRYEGYRLP